MALTNLGSLNPEKKEKKSQINGEVGPCKQPVRHSSRWEKVNAGPSLTQQYRPTRAAAGLDCIPHGGRKPLRGTAKERSYRNQPNTFRERAGWRRNGRPGKPGSPR